MTICNNAFFERDVKFCVVVLNTHIHKFWMNLCLFISNDYKHGDGSIEFLKMYLWTLTR